MNNYFKMLLIIGLLNLNVASLYSYESMNYSAQYIHRIALTKIGHKDRRINSSIRNILRNAKGKKSVMRRVRRLANKMKNLMSKKSKNYMKIRKLASKIMKALFRFVYHSHLNYERIFHYANSINRYSLSKMVESRKVRTFKS